MTSQLPRFRCIFLICQQQKNTKNGAAVTSLRSFLFCDDFIQNCLAFVKKTILEGSLQTTFMGSLLTILKGSLQTILLWASSFLYQKGSLQTILKGSPQTILYNMELGFHFLYQKGSLQTILGGSLQTILEGSLQTKDVMTVQAV